MERTDRDSESALEETKEVVVRLIRDRLSRGYGDPAAVASVVKLVEKVRTAAELKEISPQVLAAIGMRRSREGAKERRAHARRSCSLMLRILDDGTHGAHFIRDISEHGMSIYVQAPLPLFPVLRCQLPLYHLGQEYFFTARAVWCQPEPPSVVGLEYEEIGSDALAWIRAFLAS